MHNKKDKLDKIVSGISLDITDREKLSIAEYYLEAMNGNIDKLDLHLEQLNRQRPVQYVCNKAYFYGYEFYVDEAVLIPRPETEELVYWIESENKHRDDLSAVDFGSGSGCIIISLANKLKLTNAIAVDLSQDALLVTQKNASKYSVDLKCENLDVLHDELVPEIRSADIWVSNPPYIIEEEVHRMDVSVIRYEPKMALFVEDDPLVFYKQLINLFMTKAKDDCILYCEISDLYKSDLEEVLIANSLNYEFRKDMQGNWRMLKIWL